MTSQKPGLHPRNRHRSRYDMKALCLSCPELQDFIVQTPAGEPSVNFADPLAVKTLNKALLAHFMALRTGTSRMAFSAHRCRDVRITSIILPICWRMTMAAWCQNRPPCLISVRART